MDQLDPNSQGNEIQPQWVTGPIKTDDGYEGSNANFRVKVNVIKIRNTDAVIDHLPSEEQRQLCVDNEGIFSQYEQQEVASDTYQLWMRKIGPYLADWVLRLPRHENPPWKLLKFPDNYTLWIHKKGVITDRLNPRIDAYLYGAPHLGPRTARAQTAGVTIFRSPMEFVPHAIWLMRGGTGQCDCKYCIPGHQNEINRRLNRGVDAGSSDDDDDDDNNNNNNNNNNNAASSSRRRGGAQGRTRRVRRDRSPPINLNIARDYRVGATDPAPSSAT